MCLERRQLLILLFADSDPTVGRGEMWSCPPCRSQRDSNAPGVTPQLAMGGCNFTTRVGRTQG